MGNLEWPLREKYTIIYNGKYRDYQLFKFMFTMVNNEALLYWIENLKLKLK